MDGIELIAEERDRQISQEGWTLDHDAEHTDGSLALAACCYAAPVKLFKLSVIANGAIYSDAFPWDDEYDKRFQYGSCREGERDEGANYSPEPYSYNDEERIDLLIKAGALIAAEIDRLQRNSDVREGD